MNNTRTVNYRTEADIFWLSMSDDEKLDHFIIEYQEGNISIETVERLLAHKPKLLRQFKKGIR